MTAPAFAQAVLGWKAAPRKNGKITNKLGWNFIPNVADNGNVESLTLAAAILTALGKPGPPMVKTPGVPVEPGNALERGITADLTNALPSLDASRAWAVHGGRVITTFSQYAHLLGLDAAIEADPNVAVTIGRDYFIKPDVTVGIDNIVGHAPLPFLHAAVSCKWTIRSDRVQNVRHEFGRMIRHRRGRLPHLVTVTAEPLPSRLVSIARGTGEVDDVYHMTYEELHDAVLVSKNAYQAGCWHEITGQKRLRDYNELAGSLTSW